MTAELVCAASDRAAWLEARRSGVTATDIVTILGLNPWASEYALYWEKLGKLPPWEGSPRTRLGQELEHYAACLWLEDNDPGPHWASQPGLYRSGDRPWQLATPDATTSHGVWEGKTWDDHDRAAWEDGVPPRVRAQVLWQMDTLGVGVGHVGVLFLPSGEFESRTIKHRETCMWRDYPNGGGTVTCDLCPDQSYMRQVGEAFWARVREGLPPFPDGSPATLAAVKHLNAGVCAGQTEVPLEAWNAWVGAKSELKHWEAVARENEAALRIEMGGAEIATVGGEPVVKRTRYDVGPKTIERKAYTVDKLTRLGARNGESDD